MCLITLFWTHICSKFFRPNLYYGLMKKMRYLTRVLFIQEIQSLVSINQIRCFLHFAMRNSFLTNLIGFYNFCFVCCFLSNIQPWCTSTNVSHSRVQWGTCPHYDFINLRGIFSIADFTSMCRSVKKFDQSCVRCLENHAGLIILNAGWNTVAVGIVDFIFLSRYFEAGRTGFQSEDDEVEWVVRMFTVELVLEPRFATRTESKIDSCSRTLWSTKLTEIDIYICTWKSKEICQVSCTLEFHCRRNKITQEAIFCKA